MRSKAKNEVLRQKGGHLIVGGVPLAKEGGCPLEGGTILIDVHLTVASTVGDCVGTSALISAPLLYTVALVGAQVWLAVRPTTRFNVWLAENKEK